MCTIVIEALTPLNRAVHIVYSPCLLPSKFKFNAVVSFTIRVSVPISNKLWTRMERGILVLIQNREQHFPNFWI